MSLKFLICAFLIMGIVSVMAQESTGSEGSDSVEENNDYDDDDNTNTNQGENGQANDSDEMEFCGEGAHFVSCGSMCPPSCSGPTSCPLMCVPGCACEPDYVFNDFGQCIKPEDC